MTPREPHSRHVTRWAASALIVAVTAGGWFATHRELPHYLPPDTSAFVDSFLPPPADASPQTRQELDELLDLQGTRTPETVKAAQDDSHKDVSRFYEALGFDPAYSPDLPQLESLTNAVEKDVGRYVNAAKQHFTRDRPYLREPRLKPCITGVEDHNSFPSGHATYGFVMAYLLVEMVPERRTELMRRASLFAQARAICGVHYPSDLIAGKEAAVWLSQRILQDPGYLVAAEKAKRELRAALKLPAAPPPS
ncbi:MAG TPA: phosphatase PAP2 family protein [Steroidobacteraceae bacterium]|jgi:acid phosphatase (class A)|nr:phosphatase PAP2 family protein [Steroidobacteraceae bacterium]